MPTRRSPLEIEPSRRVVRAAIFGLASAMIAGPVARAQSEQVLSSVFRPAAVATFDAVRDRVVVVDGLGRIHEWDGSVWVRGRVLATPPTAAVADAAVYDPDRRTSWILAGPALGTTNLFSYDGRRVVDHGPTPGPGVIAMDTARSRLVLFTGGQTQGGQNQVDVHEWDGVAWQAVPATGGPQRLAGAMRLEAAFDPVRATTVVLALEMDATLQFSTWFTWEWDGTAWTAHPAARQLESVANPVFDPIGRHVIAMGPNGELATWTGSQWTRGAARAWPVQRLLPADDTRSSRALGVDAVEGWIWAFDGARWQIVGGPAHAVGGRAVVFDERRRTVVGIDAQGEISEWNSTNWTVAAPVVHPPSFFAAAAAYDAVRGETVLFVGLDSGGAPRGDTWVWNGGWRQAVLAGPSPRDSMAMTYDRARGRTILVGGFDNSTFLADQWEWDGIAWSRTNVVVPTPMVAVAHDEARNVLVGLGHEETWEFNGAWTRRLAHPGRGGSGSSLAYDPMRRRVVAAMYLSSALTQWSLGEWDGTAWRDVGTYRGQLVFERHRGVLLGYEHDRLVVFTSQPSAAFDQGSGCGGADEPALAPFGTPRLGNRAFQIDLLEDTGGRAAGVVLSFAPANAALPGGCTALVGASTATIFGVTDAFGMLRSPLPIPDRAPLRGVAFFAQGAVLAPSHPLGVALSAGLRLVVGD